MNMDEVSFALLLLTTCCVAWFLTGHGPRLLRGLCVGDPGIKTHTHTHMILMLNQFCETLIFFNDMLTLTFHAQPLSA